MAGEKETVKLGLKKPKLSEDRISQLPDHILLHIVSFLTTKEVMQTSILSERWRFLWTGISEISLVERSDDFQKLSRFVDLVGRMLIMCYGTHLNKFSVRFEVAKFTTTLNLWAQFLVKCKVKDVTLRDHELNGEYRLPQVLYSHSSMTSLTIFRICMNPLGAIKWVSLKRLSLEEVDLSDSVMTKLLLGSPILEVLQLNGYRGLNNFNIISSPTLATLVIEDREDCNGSILEISAPRVLDLSIIDIDKDCQYTIKNVSSVVRAKISYYKAIERRPGPNFMKQFLKSLHSVKDLELGPYCIWALSELELEGWQFPTSTLESLTLNPWTNNSSIPGILNILKSSPVLETLIIEEDHDYYDHYDDRLEDTKLAGQAAAYLQNGNMDLVHSHLKTIKITTFIDSTDSTEFMVKLIQILFTGATHLEKMIIRASNLDINIAAVKLISFPRSSPKSAVLFV